MSEDGKKDEDKGGSLKELTIAPTLTALVKPTAEYLGLELRDYVKSRVEEWKLKRRAHNLDAHLNGVRRKLEKHPASSSPGERGSFHQLEIFDEWMSNVQDVDPADEELSDLWQSLLASAARGERIPSAVVSALKTLSPKEAQLLVRMLHRPLLARSFFGTLRGETKYLAKSLEAKQILERTYTFVVAIVTSTIIVSMIVFGSSVLLLNALQSLGLLLAAALFIACILAAYYARGGLANWRITWLGEELLSYVARCNPSRRTKNPA
jgi:hypothetical protein